MEDDIKTRPQVVLVLRAIIKDNHGRILILKRNKYDRYEPERWEFPGGKLEVHQDIFESLKDEVDQETGFKIVIDSKLGFVDGHINDENSPYSGLSYVVIFFLCSLQDEKDIELSHEHEESAWVRPKKLLEYDLKAEDKNAIEGFLSNNLLTV